MTTKFKTDEKYISILRNISADLDIVGTRRPIKFMKKMFENRGYISEFSPFEKDGELERKNPVIVALGDSVTAGHFEFNFDDVDSFFYKIENEGVREDDVLEAIDVRKSYADVFRSMLIDKYKQTSVSIINSGIAGDTARGMLARLDRDVLRYDPDLILIHGSLNWGIEDGTDQEYYKTLLKIVLRIKLQLETEIVLITPNSTLDKPDASQISTLKKRVQAIRKISEEESTCIVDIYKIWEKYLLEGNSLEPLLSNGLNHPSEQVQAFHAEMIMKLFN